MKLDHDLANEIRKAQGDGSRESKVALSRRVRAACSALSTTRVKTSFYDILKEHGRVPVALCVAVTLLNTADRIDKWGYPWALSVLDCWTNRPASYLSIASIDDGLHPTSICAYAGAFIRMTTEEGDPT